MSSDHPTPECLGPSISPSPSVSQEPSIDKDVLLQKLQDIPTEVLREILTNQVDLEIRLKHKELRLTEEELGKCEAQMLALRKFFEVPNEVSFESEPSNFTLKYFDVLNKSLSVNYTKLQQQQYVQAQPVLKENIFVEEPTAAPTYRTRSTTSSLRPCVGGLTVKIAGCLYRRTDGIIVKLTCPDCGRSNFSSAQGFLNHSRIAHSKEYTLQDAAALHCGEVLPAEFQDEEGAASLASLLERNLDPSKNLNVSEMYFSGLNRTMNMPHRHSPEDVKPKEVHAEHKEESHELMKKLIKSGYSLNEASYEEMISDMRHNVTNAHLFDDEEEVEEPETHEKEALGSFGHGIVKQESDEARGRVPLCSVPTTPPADAKSSCAIESGPESHKDEPRRETGGKYENRLRRRKSRAEMLLKMDDDDDIKSKRRRSSRGP